MTCVKWQNSLVQTALIRFIVTILPDIWDREVEAFPQQLWYDLPIQIFLNFALVEEIKSSYSSQDQFLLVSGFF